MRSVLAALLFAFALPAAAASGADPLCPGNGNRIEELRIYDLVRDNRGPFHQRFREHAIRLMHRHDFDIVDIWESESGGRLQFVYVLSWPDQATMQARWAAFRADPEWVAAKRQSAADHGDVLQAAPHSQLLRRVAYSPACASAPANGRVQP